MKHGFSLLGNFPIAPAIPPAYGPRLIAVERKPARYPSQRPLKILAPIDLSGESKGAIEHAIEITEALGAELSLLNVTDPNAGAWGVTAGKFDAALPANVGRWVVSGPAPEAIASFAEFADVDLVTMASATYGGWKHLWKRSVTAQVMESTDRPILITGIADEEFRFRCRRILCALALDGTDEATIVQAESLARRSCGELILLGVAPEIDEGMLYNALPAPALPLSSRLANDRLRAVVKFLSVPWKTSVMTGSRYRCIGLAARQYAADIVVMSRSGIDTRAVFRRLTCPLLSVASAAPACERNRRAQDSVNYFEHAECFLENAGDSWR
jgi:nucleotide-binding universal stress UspA family protein